MTKEKKQPLLEKELWHLSAAKFCSSTSEKLAREENFPDISAHLFTLPGRREPAFHQRVLYAIVPTFNKTIYNNTNNNHDGSLSSSKFKNLGSTTNNRRRKNATSSNTDVIVLTVF